MEGYLFITPNIPVVDKSKHKWISLFRNGLTISEGPSVTPTSTDTQTALQPPDSRISDAPTSTIYFHAGSTVEPVSDTCFALKRPYMVPASLCFTAKTVASMQLWMESFRDALLADTDTEQEPPPGDDLVTIAKKSPQLGIKGQLSLVDAEDLANTTASARLSQKYYNLIHRYSFMSIVNQHEHLLTPYLVAVGAFLQARLTVGTYRNNFHIKTQNVVIGLDVMEELILENVLLSLEDSQRAPASKEANPVDYADLLGRLLLQSRIISKDNTMSGGINNPASKLTKGNNNELYTFSTTGLYRLTRLPKAFHFLHLTIDRGKALQPARMKLASQPYAKITYGDQKFKTKSVRSIDPLWKESIYIAIHHFGDPPAGGLKIAVFHDTLLKEFVGQVVITDLLSRCFSNTKEASELRWYPLEGDATNVNVSPIKVGGLLKSALNREYSVDKDRGSIRFGYQSLLERKPPPTSPDRARTTATAAVPEPTSSVPTPLSNDIPPTDDFSKHEAIESAAPASYASSTPLTMKGIAGNLKEASSTIMEHSPSLETQIDEYHFDEFNISSSTKHKKPMSYFRQMTELSKTNSSLSLGSTLRYGGTANSSSDDASTPKRECLLWTLHEASVRSSADTGDGTNQGTTPTTTAKQPHMDLYATIQINSKTTQTATATQTILSGSDNNPQWEEMGICTCHDADADQNVPQQQYHNPVPIAAGGKATSLRGKLLQMKRVDSTEEEEDLELCNEIEEDVILVSVYNNHGATTNEIPAAEKQNSVQRFGSFMGSVSIPFPTNIGDKSTEWHDLIRTDDDFLLDDEENVPKTNAVQNQQHAYTRIRFSTELSHTNTISKPIFCAVSPWYQIGVDAMMAPVLFDMLANQLVPLGTQMNANNNLQHLEYHMFQEYVTYYRRTLEFEREWRNTYYADIQIPDGETLLAVNDRNVVVRRYEESTSNKKKDDDGKRKGRKTVRSRLNDRIPILPAAGLNKLSNDVACIALTEKALYIRQGGGHTPSKRIRNKLKSNSNSSSKGFKRFPLFSRSGPTTDNHTEAVQVQQGCRIKLLANYSFTVTCMEEASTSLVSAMEEASASFLQRKTGISLSSSASKHQKPNDHADESSSSDKPTPALVKVHRIVTFSSVANPEKAAYRNSLWMAMINEVCASERLCNDMITGSAGYGASQQSAPSVNTTINDADIVPFVPATMNIFTIRSIRRFLSINDMMMAQKSQAGSNGYGNTGSSRVIMSNEDVDTASVLLTFTFMESTSLTGDGNAGKPPLFKALVSFITEILTYFKPKLLQSPYLSSTTDVNRSIPTFMGSANCRIALQDAVDSTLVNYIQDQKRNEASADINAITDLNENVSYLLAVASDLKNGFVYAVVTPMLDVIGWKTSHYISGGILLLLLVAAWYDRLFNVGGLVPFYFIYCLIRFRNMPPPPLYKPNKDTKKKSNSMFAIVQKLKDQKKIVTEKLNLMININCKVRALASSENVQYTNAIILVLVALGCTLLFVPFRVFSMLTIIGLFAPKKTKAKDGISSDETKPVEKKDSKAKAFLTHAWNQAPVAKFRDRPIKIE